MNKARNSAEIELTNTMKVFSDTQGVEIKIKADVQSILSPKQFYVQLELEGPEHFDSGKIELYAKDETVYIKASESEINDNWRKGSYGDILFEPIIDCVNTEKYNQFLTSVEKDLELKEIENAYEISYVKEKIDFNTILDIFTSINISGKDFREDDVKDTNVDKIDLKYIIDKDTYETKNIKFELFLSQKSEPSNKAIITNDTLYKNFNKLTEIKIPEDVIKNAMSY